MRARNHWATTLLLGLLALCGSVLAKDAQPTAQTDASRTATPVSPEHSRGPVSAANDDSEEYILRIEELDGPAPQLEHVEGVPTTGTGWLAVVNGASDKTKVVRCTELLVSTKSRFHLRVKDGGKIVKLEGRLERSVVVPAQGFDQQAAHQGYEPRAIGEQGQDFLIQVLYEHANEDGRRVRMQSPIPIRFGKTFCLGGGLGVFPSTLWSLEKVKTALADRK